MNDYIPEYMQPYDDEPPVEPDEEALAQEDEQEPEIPPAEPAEQETPDKAIPLPSDTFDEFQKIKKAFDATKNANRDKEKRRRNVTDRARKDAGLPALKRPPQSGESVDDSTAESRRDETADDDRDQEPPKQVQQQPSPAIFPQPRKTAKEERQLSVTNRARRDAGLPELTALPQRGELPNEQLFVAEPMPMREASSQQSPTQMASSTQSMLQGVNAKFEPEKMMEMIKEILEIVKEIKDQPIGFK